MSALIITRALRGRWYGTYGMVPCPAHDDSTPSCKVTDDPRKNDGIDVNCFAGCDWRDIKDQLQRQGLLGEFEPDHSQPRRGEVRHEPPPEPEPDEEALKVWRAGVPVAGTLAETYLTAHRCLAGPFPASLRYHPGLTHPCVGMVLPGLVAALQRPDRRVVAVQVTILRPADGGKSTLSVPRLTIGKLGTGMVRLAAAGAELGIAEGVETALSAMQLSEIPVWATLGGRRMARVTIPAGVRHLHIFGDNDGPGRAEAEKAAERFLREGLKVSLRFPPDGFNDWNDVLSSGSRREVA